MPAVTTIDDSIAEAKKELDAARRDGRPEAIKQWASRLDARLDRKLTQMKAAKPVSTAGSS